MSLHRFPGDLRHTLQSRNRAQRQQFNPGWDNNNFDQSNNFHQNFNNNSYPLPGSDGGGGGQQSWTNGDDSMYRRRNGPRMTGHPQRFPSFNVRAFEGQRQIVSSYEEPVSFGSNREFGNDFHGAPMSSMSVRVTNDDDYYGGMFSRRQRYSAQLSSPVELNSAEQSSPNDPAVIIEYNHKRSKGPSPKKQPPLPPPVPPSKERSDLPPPPSEPCPPVRDPRVNKFIHREPRNRDLRLSCEHPTTTFNGQCHHPRANAFVNGDDNRPTPPNIPVQPKRRLSEANNSPPSNSRINPALIDRVEREKYEKSKKFRSLGKLNPLKGDRAVDAIRPIPRPPKDPELESEIDIVIEKLNVPVITTPADFSKFKIPRVNSIAPESDSVRSVKSVRVENNVKTNSQGEKVPKNMSKQTISSTIADSTEVSEPVEENGSDLIMAISREIASSSVDSTTPRRDSNEKSEEENEPSAPRRRLRRILSICDSNSDEETLPKNKTVLKEKPMNKVDESVVANNEETRKSEGSRRSRRTSSIKERKTSSDKEEGRKETKSQRLESPKTVPVEKNLKPTNTKDKNKDARKTVADKRSVEKNANETTNVKVTKTAVIELTRLENFVSKKKPEEVPIVNDSARSADVPIVEASPVNTEPKLPQKLSGNLLDFIRNVDYNEFKQLQELLRSSSPQKIMQNMLLSGKSNEESTNGEIEESSSNLTVATELPIVSVPRTVEVPKMQSPTISSCQRIDDEQKSQNTQVEEDVEKVAEVAPPKNRRKRRNDLEKLQDDNNRNYSPGDLYTSHRSVKQPIKEAPPKKIVERRKSMCVRLRMDDVVISRTITLEPQSKKRRMSVGCRSSPPPVVVAPEPDCILNDDHFHDSESQNCKLCTKVSSGNISSHYIECHSDAEVFNCRLKYSTAMKLKQGLSSKQYVNKDRTEYFCLICEKTQSCDTYYEIFEHLVSHTGEFYFKCSSCPFRSVNFDAHHARLHKFEIFPYENIVNNQIVAYMCELCHFIQLHKPNVNKHIMCNHREETPTPGCMEVVLLDFSGLKITSLDFEELDGRFKELPVIETVENWTQFDDLYRGYLTDAPDSDNEEPECSEGPFETEVRKFLAITRNPEPVASPSSIIRIDGLSYDCASQTYEFSNGLTKIRNTSFVKMKMYLDDISVGARWSGSCSECDRELLYSQSQPVHFEIIHLQTVHWHRTTSAEESVAVGTELAMVPKSQNSCRPWLPGKCPKTADVRKKMSTLSAILSTYKCMVANCHYHTNDLSSMARHLDEHDGDPTADLDAMIECCYCEAAVGSPSDYFAHMLKEHSASRYLCPYCFYRSNYNNTMRHVSHYHADRHPFVFDGQFNGFYSPDPPSMNIDVVYDNIKTNVKPHCCPVCDMRFYPLDLYQQHLEEHDAFYTCSVCKETVPVVQFFPHLAKHDQGAFECIYCPFGAIDGPTIKRHIMDHHPGPEVPPIIVRFGDGELQPEDVGEITSIRLCQLLENNFDENCVKVVPKEIFDGLERDERSIIISNVIEGAGDIAVGRPEEDPSEKFLLTIPKQSLFDDSIKCLKCDYSTIVRMNLVRHVRLQHMNEEEYKPTSPPIQVKEPEKITNVLVDKQSVAVLGQPKIRMRRMTISEISSTNGGVPQFVPYNRRFICGIARCAYFCPEERMLRGHMEIVHVGEDYFKCPHCEKVVIGSDFQMEAVVGHYKLHAQQLFQCAKCVFYGDTRQQVSNHIRKRHMSTVAEGDIIEVRNTVETDSTVKPVLKSPPKKMPMRRNSVCVSKKRRIEEIHYVCSSCPFKGHTLDLMNQHNYDEHGKMDQFECATCNATLKSEKGFKMHVHFKHPGKQPKMIAHFRAQGSEEASQAITSAVVPSKTVGKIKDLSLESQLQSYLNKQPTHRPLVFYCHFCPERFNERETIDQHLKQHGGTINHELPKFLMYSCAFCDFNTPRSATLGQHFKAAHKMSPVFRLDYMVKCVKCDFSNTAENVAKHCAEFHEGTRPLMRNMIHSTLCGQCKYEFKDAADLETHFKMAHKSIVNKHVATNKLIILRVLNMKFDKMYKCKKCKEVLTLCQRQFHKHGKECVSVEPAHLYKCNLCATFFTTDYEEAKNHVDEHKEKKVNCERCSVVCGSYELLLKHLKGHRLVDDYKEQLLRRYSVEILFPNGFMASEVSITGALQRTEFQFKRTEGIEL